MSFHQGFGDWEEKADALKMAALGADQEGSRIFGFGIGDGNEELDALGVGIGGREVEGAGVGGFWVAQGHEKTNAIGMPSGCGGGQGRVRLASGVGALGYEAGASGGVAGACGVDQAFMDGFHIFLTCVWARAR